MRGRGSSALRRGHPRNRGPARDSPRRSADRQARRARGPRGRDRVVRVPRRVPVEDARLVKRGLPGGFELDDDPARIDLDAVYEFLAREAYWAKGRSRQTVERLIREASRVVGLFQG